MVVTTRSRTVRPILPVSPPTKKSRKQSSPRTSTTSRTTNKRAKPSPSQTPTKVRASQAKAVKQNSVRLTHAKLKRPSEYELQPNGDAIMNEFTGRPVLSEYGQRVFKERRRRMAELRAPRPDLDDRLRPRFEGNRQPMLHFGLGCNMKDIMDCAKRRGYLSRPLDDPSREINARDRVWSYFRCRQIDCTFQRVLSNDYELVVALYSNYDQFERQLVEEDEEACLCLIRTELRLGDRPPLWFWDDIKSGTYYTAPQDDFNISNLYNITVPPEDSC